MNALTIVAVSFIGLKIIYGMACGYEGVVGVSNINDSYNINMRFYRLTCCRQSFCSAVEGIAELEENVYRRVLQ